MAESVVALSADVSSIKDVDSMVNGALPRGWGTACGASPKRERTAFTPSAHDLSKKT